MQINEELNVSALGPDDLQGGKGRHRGEKKTLKKPARAKGSQHHRNHYLALWVWREIQKSNSIVTNYLSLAVEAIWKHKRIKWVGCSILSLAPELPAEVHCLNNFIINCMSVYINFFKYGQIYTKQRKCVF